MDHTLYKIRWFFLFVVWLAVFTNDFSSTGYGIVNNIVARYFNVSPTSIDSLATITYVSGAIALVVTVLFHTQIGVRAQCITVSLCGLLGAASVMIGFLQTRLYWFVFMGQFFIGISGGMCFITPILLAANWFSVKEIGTTIAILLSALHIGQIASSLVFPLLLQDAIQSQSNALKSSKVRNVFTSAFAIIALLMLISAIVVYIFAKDHPPSPSNAVHEGDRVQEINFKSKLPEMKKVLGNLKETFSYYQNINFVLITSVLMLESSFFAMTKIIIASLFQNTFPDIPVSLPGLIRVFGNIFAAIAFLLAGPLMGKLGRYKLFAVLPIVGLIPFCITTLLAHHFKWLLILEILYPILMALHGFSEITLIEYLTHVSYPAERITLMSAHYFPTLLFYAIFIAVERAILDSFGATMAWLVPLCASALSLILILVVTSRFEKQDVTNAAGSTPLLTKN